MDALSPTGQQKDYRPEIDGLRALAVLSVVLFHAGFSRFSAGFLGVDVFFVISGFLITRLIKNQVAADTFSFKGFYLRRARRLLPALLFTTCVSTICAYFLLSPKLLAEFGAAAVWASLSLSNVYFYRQSDYFDSDAIFKPLLHTWSLSVEEQFYLVWPACLVLALRYLPKRLLPWLVLGLGMASFAAAELLVAHRSAVFYLTPFRAFEFASGAVLVWTRAPKRNGLLEAGLGTGLALILLSLLGLLTFSHIPGLAPSLGTALVLYCGQAKYGGLLLRNRLSVGIGVISYSVYLVHWPLLVFAKYDKFDSFSTSERALLVLAALVIGALLHQFVETPFRRGGRGVARGTDRQFVFGYLTGLVAVLAVTAHMWRYGGWLWRYPQAIREQIDAARLKSYESYTWAAHAKTKHAFAGDGRRRVLIVGDSQSADFVNLLAETARLERDDLATLRMDMQCQALISFAKQQFDALSREDQAWCQDAFVNLVERPTWSGAESVVLVFNWDDRGIPFIPTAVTHFRQQGAERVFVVGRKSQGYSGADVVLRYGMSKGAEGFSASKKNPVAWSANTKIQTLGADFRFIDLMSQVCPTSNACHVLTDDQNIIFFDGSHFTPSGARYVGALIAEAGALSF